MGFRGRGRRCVRVGARCGRGGGGSCLSFAGVSGGVLDAATDLDGPRRGPKARGYRLAVDDSSIRVVYCNLRAVSCQSAVAALTWTP